MSRKIIGIVGSGLLKRGLTISSNNAAPTGAGATIIDASRNVWKITSGQQLSFNGLVIGATSGVTQIAYVNGVVWQLNTSAQWYSMGVSNGSAVTLSGPQTTTPIETITGITLSASSFTGGSASGTVVGTITVTTTGPAFSGTLSLSGTNASSFQIVGTSLETNGVVANGSYAINIIATQASAVGSPFTQAKTITGSAVLATMTPSNFGAHFISPNTSISTVNAQGVPIGTVRVWDAYHGGFDWANLETSNGTYSWSNFDTIMSAATTAGWPILWSNGYTPTWENSSSPGGSFPNPFPPSNNTDYSNFMTAVVSRAAGRIALYEVWNEANDASGYFSGTKAQLIALAQILAGIVRPTGALASAPSFTFPDTGCPYMIQYLVQGGATWADAASAHIYPHDVTDPSSGINGHGLAEQVLQQAWYWIASADAGGLAGKPVYITEGGYLNGNVVQATNQLIWSALWPMLPLSAGCVATYFYAWDNFTNTSFLYSGSALTSNGVAYKTMTNWLNGASWVNRVARVYNTNAITNTAGTGVGNGNTTAPTGWSVNNPDSAKNVSYQFLGSGTQNGMNYVTWRAFTTAPVGSTPAGAIQLFLCSATTATTSQWWFLECFLALDPASTMTNGIPSGISGGMDGVQLQIQNNSFGSIVASANSAKICACSIDKGHKIMWGITGASGVTTIQPYIWLGYSAGATFDVRLRIGVGSTPGADGAPTCDTSTIWNADISKSGGFQGRIRWDMSNKPTSYTPPSPYNAFTTNLAGTKTAISSAVSLTNQPQLLSNQ